MRFRSWIATTLVAFSCGAWAQQAEPAKAAAPATSIDQVIDRIITREHALMDALKDRTPVVETYLQNMKADPNEGPVPENDRYFLGHMDLGEDLEHRSYLKDDEGIRHRLLGGFEKLYTVQYKPLGFAWMVYIDHDDFSRQVYDFKFLRREFLGDVRCLVFDITPKRGSGNGRFLGRIWVEDQDYNIVRLNGTYAPRPRNEYFFHMDSWRLNLIPGYWVPAYIYSEEGDFRLGQKNKFAFKAQTRIWGYDLKNGSKQDELTSVLVDSPTVQDQSAAAQDASPLESQRIWQQQAEDNAVDRLERSGLLAPPSEVDKVLETVVNNLMITNNIELQHPVHCRTLLTSPLETFSVGNTIVISRGLVDVLPDEASLATILSHELAHIVLGQNVGSQYAFTDRMLFSDEETYQGLGFKHDEVEEQQADKKALEMLKKSPYAQKLDTPGLFLRVLAARAAQMPNLLTPHLGNSLATNGTVTRLTEVMVSAPQLDFNKVDQIAALPLGGRVKMNPWSSKIELIKAAPVAITSGREKMPFQVTPFFPRLQRLNTNAAAEHSVAANTTAPAPAATGTENK